MALADFDFHYEKFLDKITILYGETGTGKSFIMVDILYNLKRHAEQIIVVSPMDKQNHTYDRGLVPRPCIHYTLTPELLNDIWERQAALGEVYSKANNPNTLFSLFNKIPDNREAQRMLHFVTDARNKSIEEVRSANFEESLENSKVNDIEKTYSKFLHTMYKHHINENSEKLKNVKLTKDEKYSLKYINLNPRLVLVLDDCTDLLKKYKSHPVMQKLFYQGRWAFITAIIASHTDKCLDPELKKNAYISIFTEASCAHAYFERKSNDWDKEARQRAAAACKSAFTPLLKHQKLAWVREEKKFYKLMAKPHDNFRFGSPCIWEYCKQIQLENSGISSSNKFFSQFDNS